MKKHSRAIGALLTLTMLLGLLPMSAAAQDTVAGADLRAGTVERVEAIMDVDWTLQARQAKASITGQDRLDYQAAGIVPTTYFEYSRLRFNYKGVIVENNPATLEEFAAMASMEHSVVEGIPHNTYSNAELKGMDINSFLTDVSTRLLKQPLTGLRQALTSQELTALAVGADLSAASSKAGIGFEAAKAGYEKLGAGDLLLAWDDNADAVEGGHPRIHALVVKEVNGEQVTVMYPAFSLLLWYFKCDKCGVVETEGPTSATVPNHVESLGYSFGNFRKHDDCGGEWGPLYATTWRTETVSYDQLYGQGDAAVPYGSFGYLPYTFNAYAQGAKTARVTVESGINEENYLSGFTAHVTSDYRITGVKAVITRNGEVIKEVTGAPALGSKEYTFSNPAMDEALRTCPSGTANKLSFYVRSGPLTGAELEQDAYREVYSFDFTVGQNVVSLSADKDYLGQGERINVSVNALENGFTGMRAHVVYDPKSYVFEPETSRAANPGVTFEDRGGQVVVERYGKALGAGDTAATLVFHALRTGAFPIEAKDNGQIYCSGVYISTKAGATAADLKVAKPDATAVQPAVGYNVIIYEDYAAGQDLLVLFTATEEQIHNQTDSTLKMAYDGKPMYDVTTARYETGEGDIQRIYAVLAEQADVGKISVGGTACEQLLYTDDVNQSGVLDIRDVQTVANIINGTLPLKGNEIKWLMADVDRSGKVDMDDLNVLLNKLLG